MLVLLLLHAVTASDAAGYRYCYGNVADLNPGGQRYGGVKASEKDVNSDLPALNVLKACYQQVADQNCIQASVIAALASRSSRGGELIQYTDGMGPTGAYGILQCHPASGLPCNACTWSSCCHISMMVSRLLVPSIQSVQTRQPYWSKAQTLQGGVAAYSFGVKNVQTWTRLDVGSPNNDFSNDVMARAQVLYNMGWN